MDNFVVYYQNKKNHLACTRWHPTYTNDFSKTHTKVYEGVLKSHNLPSGNVKFDLENVFQTFNHDQTNPLSYTNDVNKVCVIGNSVGTGKDFQDAMRNKKIKVGHTSMSVGDIVSYKGKNYLCADIGWKKLTDEPIEEDA